MALETSALLASGLFAGAAIYINLVEHPARMECGTEVAVAEFAPSYRRAAVMQGLLAAIGFAAGTAAWLRGSGAGWLAGGIAQGLVIPFTLLVIHPTNKRLLDPALDRRSALARDLMRRWSRLHAVRSILGAGAFVLFVCLVGFRHAASGR